MYLHLTLLVIVCVKVCEDIWFLYHIGIVSQCSFCIYTVAEHQFSMPKCVCCCGDNRLCQTSTLLQSCCITDLYVMAYHLKQAHNAIFCFRCMFFVDLPKSVRVGLVSCLLLQCIDGMYSFYLSVMCCKMSSWLVPLKGAWISLFIHIRL